MAVKIRLRRVGAKKQPSYRFVAADERCPRDGRFLEILGHYNPLTEPATVVINEERMRFWMSKGAVPSDGAWRVLARQGFLPKRPIRQSKPKQAEAEGAS